MGRNNFIGSFGKHQVTNLRASVNVIYWLKGMRVPETNASVGCSSTSGEKSCLVWIPSNSFDGSLMLTELSDGWLTVKIPNHQFVVIRSTCKLLSIWGPFQSTNLLLMAYMFCDNAVLGSKITTINRSISWPSADNRTVPRYRADSGQMITQSSHDFTLGRVPYLRITVVCSDG